MPTKASKFIPVALALAAISPTVATAAIPNPQSDAAMRKAVRNFASHGVKDKTVKASKIKIDCVQAAKIGSTRPCSGTFSLTLAGRTARYKLTDKSSTFRISPGAIQADLRAKATKRAAGLPSSIKTGSILQ
jgi:hypothetical protein